MSEYPGTQKHEGQAIDVLQDQLDIDEGMVLVGQHLIDLIAHALKYAENLGDAVSSHQLIDAANADFHEFVDAEEVEV